jgi:radical SAM superfamily enzyme with C-terminal helix-hairpin-helix motif
LPEKILKEIEGLVKNGARYFRLGRAANILAYGYTKNDKDGLFLDQLYSGIRQKCPKLGMLHTDNANPGFIQNNPMISEKAIKIISQYNTSGDSLSFGVESFDETVIKQNNLAIDPDGVISACETVNRVGGFLKDGVPALLPGINLLFGLIGESTKTFDINFKYLKKLRHFIA